MKKVFQLFVLFMLVGCGQEESISITVPQSEMDKNMQDGEIFLQSNLSQSGVIEVEPGSVSYTHLTLPTNREV